MRKQAININSEIKIAIQYISNGKQHEQKHRIVAFDVPEIGVNQFHHNFHLIPEQLVCSKFLLELVCLSKYGHIEYIENSRRTIYISKRPTTHLP